MKKLQQLTKEINELTLKIEQEYPEVYRYLDENPITITSYQHPELTVKTFSDYLDSLKGLLQSHIETHKNSET
ncbi:MAG: hypothetical protein R3D00_11520 [Bacteroidia bacterium]